MISIIYKKRQKPSKYFLYRLYYIMDNIMYTSDDYKTQDFKTANTKKKAPKQTDIFITNEKITLKKNKKKIKLKIKTKNKM